LFEVNPLVDYILATGKRMNPFTAAEFSSLEMNRILRLASVHRATQLRSMITTGEDDEQDRYEIHDDTINSEEIAQFDDLENSLLTPRNDSEISDEDSSIDAEYTSAFIIDELASAVFEEIERTGDATESNMLQILNRLSPLVALAYSCDPVATVDTLFNCTVQLTLLLITRRVNESSAHTSSIIRVLVFITHMYHIYNVTRSADATGLSVERVIKQATHALTIEVNKRWFQIRRNRTKAALVCIVVIFFSIYTTPITTHTMTQCHTHSHTFEY